MRTVALPLFSSLIALLAVGVWQVGGCRAQQAQHREEFLEQGQALLAAAEGLVARETRGGMVDPAVLQETLDHARETFGLEGVRVVTVAGGVLAESGLVGETEVAGQRFEKTMEVLRPRHEGRGPPWGQGPGRHRLEGDALTLMLWLPMDELQARLAQDASRATVTALALGLTILLFGGVFWMRTRSLELRAALEAGQRELESLERLRRVGAGLVHETKNPLGVVRGFAERILRTPLERSQLEQAARAIVDETDRTVARLDEFLLFSRPAELRRTPVAVRPLFEELAQLLDPDLEAGGVELVITCGDVVIDGDREQLRRLFLNLLLNALQALECGGSITLACRSTGNGVALSVEDDGCGIPEALKETLFEPYVTQREGGSGLGLSIASRIAVDHGFVLRHEPNTPKGTRMILEVPRL